VRTIVARGGDIRRKFTAYESAWRAFSGNRALSHNFVPLKQAAAVEVAFGRRDKSVLVILADTDILDRLNVRIEAGTAFKVCDASANKFSIFFM
jgi:hypothetical protein